MKIRKTRYILTATGTLILKKFIGSISNNEAIKVNNVQVALAASTSTREYRCFNAVYWYTSDEVELASDIGINLPSGCFYKNLENENTAPDGVTFGLY
jgi:hypothetical protein